MKYAVELERCLTKVDQIIQNHMDVLENLMKLKEEQYANNDETLGEIVEREMRAEAAKRNNKISNKLLVRTEIHNGIRRNISQSGLSITTKDSSVPTDMAKAVKYRRLRKEIYQKRQTFKKLPKIDEGTKPPGYKFHSTKIDLHATFKRRPYPGEVAFSRNSSPIATNSYVDLGRKEVNLTIGLGKKAALLYITPQDKNISHVRSMLTESQLNDIRLLHDNIKYMLDCDKIPEEMNT